MRKDQIIRTVRRYLQDRQPANNPIEVMEQSVRSDGDRWYVPARPNHTIPKTYEYSVVLSDVESESKQKEALDVLLVPTA